jgi:hypothetical protein
VCVNLNVWYLSSGKSFVQTCKGWTSPNTSLHHILIFICSVTEYGLDNRGSTPKRDNIKLRVNFIVWRPIRLCRRVSILVTLEKN